MANPSTTDAKKTAKTTASTPNPTHDVWLAAINTDGEEWQRGFAPGEWGALAAKAWGCSVDDALQRAIELLEVGRLEPATVMVNHQLSFECRVHSTPLRSNKRATLLGMKEALAWIATADNAHVCTLGGLHPDAELVLIAFGKLVPRNFELYPAPRVN